MDFLDSVPEEIREEVRRQSIKDKFDFCQIIWIDELERFGLYIDTIDNFIDNEEKAEVEALERWDNRLKDKEQSLDWAWHYPVYWDDTFRNKLYSSSITMLVSFMELFIRDACEFIQLFENTPITVHDLKGGLIRRSKQFILKLGNFNSPDEKDWQKIKDIYDIRCQLVHNNGFVESDSGVSKMSNIVKTIPGIEMKSSHLEIKKEFIEYCLKSIRDFSLNLLMEMKNRVESMSYLG